MPRSVFHIWNDHRDKSTSSSTGRSGAASAGPVTAPYSVPYEVPLGMEISRGRRLPAARCRSRPARRPACPPACGGSHPERSEAWLAYKQKWFAAAIPARGGMFGAPAVDVVPGVYGPAGLETRYNSSGKFFDVAGTATLLKIQLGSESVPLCRQRTDRLSALQRRRGRGTRRPRARTDRSAGTARHPRLHSRRLANHVRRRQERLGPFDAALSFRLRPFEEARAEDRRSPRDQLAQAGRRVVLRARRTTPCARRSWPELAHSQPRGKVERRDERGLRRRLPTDASRAGRRPGMSRRERRRSRRLPTRSRGAGTAADRSGARSCGTGIAGEAGSRGRRAPRSRSARDRRRETPAT
jgi:hypothetical protein